MKKRRNFLWGVIAVIVAALILLRTLDVLPEGLYDLMVRAAPVLLVLFGLTLLLRNRVPMSGLVALGITGALVVGIGAYAFSTRAAQQRDDHVQPIAQQIDDGITLLAITVDVMTTDVEVRVAQTSGETISGQFIGSRESDIQVEYQQATQGRATLNVRETRPNPFPMLEAVGRGKLTLQIPPGMAVDLAVNSQQGIASLDMTQISLERLSLTLQQGDAFVTLPEYSPRSPNAQDQPGTLNILNGHVTLLIPQNVAARLELLLRNSGIEPQYDERLYNFLRGDILENRRIDDMTIIAHYIIDIPRGQVKVETVP